MSGQQSSIDMSASPLMCMAVCMPSDDIARFAATRQPAASPRIWRWRLPGWYGRTASISTYLVRPELGLSSILGHQRQLLIVVKRSLPRLVRRPGWTFRRGPSDYRWQISNTRPPSTDRPVQQPARMLTRSSPDASFVIGSVRKDSPRECGASTSVGNSAAAPATVGG